jgi:hypothetical protein
VCEQCLREANAAFQSSALLDGGVGIGVVFVQGMHEGEVRRGSRSSQHAGDMATALRPQI